MIKKDWAKQLSLNLRQLGFEMTRCRPSEPSFLFGRPRKDNLFEHIDISFSGRKNEAVVCYVGVSVTKHIPLKGLSEIYVLKEVAGEPEHCWTIINNKQDRIRWFALVEKQAIIKLDDIADTVAELLKERCAQSINRACECLAFIDKHHSIYDIGVRLKSSASEELLGVTRRVVEWPGVVQLYNSFDLYETAALLVLTKLYAGQLPNPLKPAEMPLENQSLMWELQIVADKLLQKFEPADPTF